MGYLIRRMQENEVEIAISWAKKEGWNPGLEDAKCFYKADPNGFFLGLVDGEPIATGAAVVYSDRYAFCGLYIVKPEYRSHGYGLKLTEERLKYAGNRITGLDGVIANVNKYERLGYVSAHKNIRYMFNVKKQTSVDPHIQPIPLDQLEKYDRRFFPAPRMNFLHCWIGQAQHAFAYMHEGILKGYGVIRKCFEGYKVGPLFADSPKIARALFEALCSKVPEGSVYLDIPEPNKEGLALAKEYGMSQVFEVIRMYRNGFPEVDLMGTFGVTTFEIG